jgi:hypothetical protein
LEIYDTIESMGRFQLKDLRDEHAKARIDQFTKLFFNTTISQNEKTKATEEYVKILLEQIDNECEEYSPIQE